MSAERADDRRTVAWLRSGPCQRKNGRGTTLFAGSGCSKTCAEVIRRASTPLSFPPATDVSRWLPTLADIPQFKRAPHWVNEAIENVRNTSGDKLLLSRNMVCIQMHPNPSPAG